MIDPSMKSILLPWKAEVQLCLAAALASSTGVAEDEAALLPKGENYWRIWIQRLDA